MVTFSTFSVSSSFPSSLMGLSMSRHVQVRSRSSEGKVMFFGVYKGGRTGFVGPILDGVGVVISVREGVGGSMM